MDKLERTCIACLYHCYATSHPLSELSMRSHIHTMSPPNATGCSIRRHIKVLVWIKTRVLCCPTR